jgi:hypothetical protein
MAPSAVMDDDNQLLLLLLARCHLRVIESILYYADFRALLPDDQRKFSIQGPAQDRKE